MKPKNWEDRYYDGDTDFIFESFGDEGTPEDELDTYPPLWEDCDAPPGRWNWWGEEDDET